MKIIGKTSEGFICTVTKTEISSILSVNDSRKEDIEKNIRVGNDLTFTNSLTNLNLIKDIVLSGDYKSLGRLNDAIEQLEEIMNNINTLQEPLISIQKKIKESQA